MFFRMYEILFIYVLIFSCHNIFGFALSKNFIKNFKYVNPLIVFVTFKIWQQFMFIVQILCTLA
jgi:hypothetical protein